MLDVDEGSEVPSASTNVRVSPQYFDGEKRVADGLAHAIGVDQPVWDAFYFYPPGATWTEHGLPLPEVAIAQDNGVVVGSLDSLPALPDQSRLPLELRGKAVVIGEQKDFETILKQVAEPFAARHRVNPLRP
jgi:hypothetical protein